MTINNSISMASVTVPDASDLVPDGGGGGPLAYLLLDNGSLVPITVAAAVPEPRTRFLSAGGVLLLVGGLRARRA